MDEKMRLEIDELIKQELRKLHDSLMTRCASALHNRRAAQLILYDAISCRAEDLFEDARKSGG